MDVFAPYFKINGCFIVKNISPQIKTITIFQYPINYLCERDLLQIPGVAENDIRASLLKGELQHKIRALDIVVVCSDVDLLQFNDSQKKFLQNAGIVNGLQVGPNQLAFLEQQDITLVGAVNSINTVFTIPSGTWVQSPPYKIIVYKNGVKQVLGDDFTIAESGGPGTGFDTVILAVPPETVPAPPDVITADYYINNA
jgi:hypothetical protein